MITPMRKTYWILIIRVVIMCDIVCVWLATFRKNVLLPSSEREIQVLPKSGDQVRENIQSHKSEKCSRQFCCHGNLKSQKNKRFRTNC